MSRPATTRIDLGIAVSALSLKPGQTRTLRELAAFCDCSHEALRQIEIRALRKCRIALDNSGLDWRRALEKR